jgi:hypothetical protein
MYKLTDEETTGQPQEFVMTEREADAGFVGQGIKDRILAFVRNALRTLFPGME